MQRFQQEAAQLLLELEQMGRPGGEWQLSLAGRLCLCPVWPAHASSCPRTLDTLTCRCFRPQAAATSSQPTAPGRCRRSQPGCCICHGRRSNGPAAAGGRGGGAEAAGGQGGCQSRQAATLEGAPTAAASCQWRAGRPSCGGCLGSPWGCIQQPARQGAWRAGGQCARHPAGRGTCNWACLEQQQQSQQPRRAGQAEGEETRRRGACQSGSSRGRAAICGR